MLSTLFTISACLSLAFSQTGPAPVITNNQPGEWHVADIAHQHGPGNVTGSIGIVGDVEGKGVRVSYTFEGFDLNDAKEYSYHIHEKPVPEDGNCNNTGKHFDKYSVGDDFVCDKLKPEGCQLGDLSGKHGIINFSNSTANLSDYAYHDEYLSTSVGDTAFFGDLSIVVHRKADKFRLACGNFRLFYDADTSATVGATPFETRILGNGTATDALLSSVTTSTQVLVLTASRTNEGASSAGTATQIATGPAGSSATHTPGATTAKSSSVSVQTGSAEKGALINVRSLVLELTVVALFASCLG